MVRTLTNNPRRRSMSWVGFKQVTTEAKRGVRRLIKRDPKKGITQPFADRITTTVGVTGLSGPTSATTLSKARTAAPGAGKKRIRDQGKNTNLSKR
jgi:hypothetical protein